MAELGPLEDDPQGQRMSRGGAERFLNATIQGYADFLNEIESGIRPGRVREELVEIAEGAANLRRALQTSSDYARLAVDDLCGGGRMNPDPEMRYFFELADGFSLPGPGSLDGHRDDSAHWLVKLEALEAIHRRAAEDPKWNDTGNGQLRAGHRLGWTPNNFLIRRSRALLAACGRPHGGGRGGPLDRLALAIREVATHQAGTTMAESISAVLRAPHAQANHEAETAGAILEDLRGRRPEGHPDTVAAELALHELHEKLRTALDLEPPLD